MINVCNKNLCLCGSIESGSLISQSVEDIHVKQAGQDVLCRFQVPIGSEHMILYAVLTC